METAETPATIDPERPDYEVPPEFFHKHPGQMKAWVSVARILAIFAGWQSGKTVSGPWLLLREIQRCGPGDYAAVAPSFPLLNNKALPELKLALGQYFDHKKAENILVLRPGAAKILWGEEKLEETRILLRHTQDPDAVEAFTAKAIWLDEPGQMKDEIWESVQARVAIHQGRIILTSRPYRKNWYVTQIWNRKDIDPDIEVVNFKSIDNPAFPRKEYERQKRLMPRWKFLMKYDGIPTKAAGLIYDCIEDRHRIPRFTIPAHWPRFVGIDFGNNNTAALKVAEEKIEGAPSRFIIYGTYKPGERRSASGPDGHVARIKKGEPVTPLGVGGSHQEDGWRDSWSSAGLPVKEPPVNSIAVQIAQVYELFASDRLVFFDDLDDFNEEVDDYAWPVDDNGEVESDDKPHDDADYHLMAALRYLGAYLNPPKPSGWAQSTDALNAVKAALEKRTTHGTIPTQNKA